MKLKRLDEYRDSYIEEEEYHYDRYPEEEYEDDVSYYYPEDDEDLELMDELLDDEDFPYNSEYHEEEGYYEFDEDEDELMPYFESKGIKGKFVKNLNENINKSGHTIDKLLTYIKSNYRDGQSVRFTKFLMEYENGFEVDLISASKMSILTFEEPNPDNFRYGSLHIAGELNFDLYGTHIKSFKTFGKDVTINMNNGVKISFGLK